LTEKGNGLTSQVDGGPTLPITMTVATVQGWPQIAAALNTLRIAAEATGGEVIVADGSGRVPPTQDQLGPAVRWTSHPGESIFQLRYRTYRAARSGIVAVTEDHVHVPPDWGTRMIAAHREHAEAAAIGGSVTNGATDSVMDWASFLIVQAPAAAPMRSGRAKRLSGAVNVSYKRAALDRIDTHEGMGAIDVLLQRELAHGGEILLNDDTIRVAHVQPLGFRSTTVLNFHAGRTISGFRRKRMDPVQVVRILGAPFVPLVRYVRTVALLAPKGYGPVLIRCTPAILWLLYAQGLGQFIGYIAGEGESPRKVL
jgi:hypothetical protein